jgi:type VI secretion system protein ImpM
MLEMMGRSQVALLGKAPCQGDFIRWNAGDALSQAFHRWLEEAHEAVRRANARLPETPVGFVFTAPGGRQALVGTLAASSDRVGRAFPLAVYLSVNAASAAEQVSALPDSFRAFFAAGRQLLADAASLSLGDLESRLAALASVSAGDAVGAEAQRRRVLASPAAPLLQRLQADGEPAGVPYYAFNTLLKACQAERGKEPSKPGVTLECPFPQPLGPFPWVELAKRQLRWRTAPPALFWHDGPAPRAFVSIGTPGVSVLMHLAKPEHSSMKVWPLRTRQAAAVESARQALSPAQRKVLEDPGTTVEALLTAFDA